MEEISLFTKLIELLRVQPVLTLFLILGVGYLIGGIRLGSFSLGPVAGVLFAGLFLGHFGLGVFHSDNTTSYCYTSSARKIRIRLRKKS